MSRVDEELAWSYLLRWDETFDYSRDTSDFSRRWADTEAETVAMPENQGEWKASLESAFQAGMKFEDLRRLTAERGES